MDLILLGAIGLLIAIGIALYVGMARADSVRERLAAGVFDETPEDVSLWRDAADLLQLAALQALIDRSPIIRRLSEQLNRTGYTLPLSRVLFGSVLFVSMLSGAAYVAQPQTWVPLATALALPMTLWLALNAWVEHRMNRLDKLLPAFVTQMLTALRSGATPLAALQSASRITPDPLGPSLRHLLDTIQIGIPPAQAWREWSERVGSAQCKLLATGVRLKWEAGGQMTSMLEHILESLQSRERLILRVRTLTAQAQLAAWVLTGLPVVFWLFTYYQNPRMFRFMLDDPLGVQVLSYGAGLLVVGFFWLRKIAKLEV